MTDLRTGRRVVQVAGGIWPASRVQVTTHGDLLIGEEREITLHRRGGGRRVLSRAPASAMAVAGNVAYWTEGGAARSATLPGVQPGPESLGLDPVFAAARRDACATAPGRVVAAAPLVRVRVVHGIRVACRIGAPRALRLDRRGAKPAAGRTYRIAGDRWLLAREDGLLRVVDTRAGRLVTRARGAIRSATLLRDGTIAWIRADGAALAQPPGGAARQIGTGARALASAGTTAYWTTGGAAQSWTRG